MPPDLAAVIRLALRHYDEVTTTDAERDAILAVIASESDTSEGEAAARVLHHRQQARSAQMQLTQLFTARRTA